MTLENNELRQTDLEEFTGAVTPHPFTEVDLHNDNQEGNQEGGPEKEVPAERGRRDQEGDIKKLKRMNVVTLLNFKLLFPV